jgi:hypothetical protein
MGLSRFEHAGEYRWHDDDCLCKMAGVEYCNRNGHIWSCCGETEESGQCPAAGWTPSPPNYPPASSPPPAVTPDRRFRRWTWTGILPGGTRPRRYRFILNRGELTIPVKQQSRDDATATHPEQEAFLNEQTDLVALAGPCIWHLVDGADSVLALRTRLKLLG